MEWINLYSPTKTLAATTSTPLESMDYLQIIVLGIVQGLTEFLPVLGDAEPGPMLTPVDVSDVTDGKIVHLAGLDLSRAWCLSGIAHSLPRGDVRRERTLKLAEAHVAKGLGYVTSGHYEGEHWLGTFAVYALTSVGTEGGE